MTTSTGISVGESFQSAVPTLKVMRLQSPELRQTNAGSLESCCNLGATLGLPDSFGVIHVGETFTAYLGALNVSKDLLVLGLTVSAQLQTPNHRWPLPSRLDASNQAGGVEVAPGNGIDTIVSRALKESGQHILRVEVGYRTGDGSTKTLRKFYRFNVTSPLNIQELTVRSSDQSCFVSISVENASTNGSAMIIYSVEFQTVAGLVAEQIGGTAPTTRSSLSKNEGNGTKRISAAKMFDACGQLEPGASFRYMFHVKSSSEDASLKGIACGDDLGVALFTWRKAMGEAGRIASTQIICPEAKPPGLLNTDGSCANPSQFMMGTKSRYVVHGSGLSVDVAAVAANRSANNFSAKKGSGPALDQALPVTVEPVEPPSRMVLMVPQEVKFLIVNHSANPLNLQLQFRLNNMRGVVVCGKGFLNLGEIPPSGGSTIMGVRFMALVAGFLQIQGCCIVDLTTGKEIPQPPLFNVFVETTDSAEQ